MNQTNRNGIYHIVVAVGEPRHLTVLLALAAPLARRRQGRVTPVYVSEDGAQPAWLQVPASCADVTDAPVILRGNQPGELLLAYANSFRPNLLLLHWRGRPSRGRYLLGRTLDPLIQYAPCDVAVMRVDGSPEAFAERMQQGPHILIPYGGGPNAELAARLALDLSEEAPIAALRVASQHSAADAIAAQLEGLRAMVARTHQPERFDPRVVAAPTVVRGIQSAARDYDLVLVGASGESYVDRVVFGNVPQQLATTLDRPLLIVRHHRDAATEAMRKLRWRLIGAMPQLSAPERVQVYRQIRDVARSDRDYVVMMVLAASIASLGLLLDSTAVLIGAMLVAPLMSALLGISMGIVQGDKALVRMAARTVLLGAAMVVAIGGLVELIAPDYSPTGEMLARTAPTLLDLGVALVSGAAAAYASARRDVASALPGVAIAVALAPPLANFGLLLLAGHWSLALGALLLFLTNLVGIIAAAAMVYLWMGFRPNIADQQRARMFRGGVLATAVLGVVVIAALGVLSTRALHAASLRRQVGASLQQNSHLLGQDAYLADWEVLAQQDLVVALSVETSEDISTQQTVALQQALAEDLGRPVALQLKVIPVRLISGSP
ncbi:MAG: DUF389 domain-containing protein [Anaerolineae bacterium]|nr:DUF389 domain-containing protein [Chloroflexota bacterium]